MASIRKEAIVHVPAEQAWAALRDVAHPDKVFAGVLTKAHLEGDIREVTFANGMVVKERIVDVDDERRRIAYAVMDGVFEHHSASMEIIPQGADACRFVWITDLLPDDKASMVAPLVDQGSQALVRNLEQPAARERAR
jgi:hypothetical protein